jgi:NADPH:quinone reductase-like Zn-dependent oxidoreductase
MRRIVTFGSIIPFPVEKPVGYINSKRSLDDQSSKATTSSSHIPHPTMASPYAVNPQPFAGKVITVTGASRGTGLALTKYLLARGATVSMCATSSANLDNAAAEIDQDFPEARDRYWTCVVDISKLDTVKSWIEQTVAKFGKLDGCANVAGELPPYHTRCSSC